MDSAALLADLEWLLAVCGGVRVLDADGHRIVRVTVDLDETTVVVVKQTIGPSGPMLALRTALTSSRLSLGDHQRRRSLRLVRQVPA